MKLAKQISISAAAITAATAMTAASADANTTTNVTVDNAAQISTDVATVQTDVISASEITTDIDAVVNNLDANADNISNFATTDAALVAQNAVSQTNLNKILAQLGVDPADFDIIGNQAITDKDEIAQINANMPAWAQAIIDKGGKIGYVEVDFLDENDNVVRIEKIYYEVLPDPDGPKDPEGPQNPDPDPEDPKDPEYPGDGDDGLGDGEDDFGPGDETPGDGGTNGVIDGLWGWLRTWPFIGGIINEFF